jgi:hypothetical protein
VAAVIQAWAFSGSFQHRPLHRVIRVGAAKLLVGDACVNTDEDNLSSQIRKKFGRYRHQVGFPTDDAAMQRVLFARLVDRQDSLGFPCVRIRSARHHTRRPWQQREIDHSLDWNTTTADFDRRVPPFDRRYCGLIVRG